jgi:hypothetical protein
LTFTSRKLLAVNTLTPFSWVTSYFITARFLYTLNVFLLQLPIFLALSVHSLYPSLTSSISNLFAFCLF